MFDSSVVNEPSGFEPLKFYSNCTLPAEKQEVTNVVSLVTPGAKPTKCIKAPSSVRTFGVNNCLG